MSTAENLTASDPSGAHQLNRLQAVYRRRGWTVWHGNATGQYWAAHTGQMVLLSGDSAREVAAKIERLEQSSRPRAVAPSRPAQARQTGGRRLPLRPRPRGIRNQRGTMAGHR